jgi:hypothetical protein
MVLAPERNVRLALVPLDRYGQMGQLVLRFTSSEAALVVERIARVSAWDTRSRSEFTSTLWAQAGKTIGDGIAVAICAQWSSAPTSMPYPGSLRKAPEAQSESEGAERKRVRCNQG